MYKCKFTCGMCGNHLEQDSGSTPPGWFTLTLTGTQVDGKLQMMVCKLCLPMPVTKSAVKGLLPTIRKKIANWWT